MFCFRLEQLRESGHLDHILMSYLHRNVSACLVAGERVNKERMGQLRPLEIGDFYGILMLYFGGETYTYTYIRRGWAS